MRASFDDQLKRLGTDWLDIGMIHYVDSLANWKKVEEGGILDYALGLKKQGVIRALGLSSHNPKVALKAVEEGAIKVLMFSVNPCYDLQPADEDVEQLWNREKYKQPLTNMDADRARLYETCMERGVGITVMKAFGGGDLLHAERSLAGVALTAHQAIAYALDRPAVACVLAGARSLGELEECLSYGAPGSGGSDYADVLARFPRISWKGHCMYCGHCAPCTEYIDIAMVIKLLNLACAQNEVPETVREHYRALPARADACSQCGVCETRCPFEVKIREQMARAREVFS
ncbi:MULTISPECIES: aldo/keto reductase [unclassified Desulfovibrio]|uniref:aldo/keto reductase n=1 Tax=unclassified Desulfovibrio TaxID=2593640 RepID=UPI00197CC12E|nr:MULTISPECIES: aldo/keto reductase [unclassified Desulfovibrio]